MTVSMDFPSPEIGSKPMPSPAIPVEALWMKMSGPLARYAGKMLGAQAAGEDTVQDVFGRYLEKRPVFALLVQQEAWLWRSVRNAVLDILRSKRHRITDSLDDLISPNTHTDRTSYEPPDGNPDPECVASNRETLRLAQAAFETLSRDDRDILWMSEVEGLEVSDLAAIYRRPATLVKVRLHRARKRLRAGIMKMEVPEHG